MVLCVKFMRHYNQSFIIVINIPAGGCGTPSLTIAIIENAGAIATRNHIGRIDSGIYVKHNAIKPAIVCPKIALRGCDAGAAVNPYCNVMSAPNGPILFEILDDIKCKEARSMNELLSSRTHILCTVGLDHRKMHLH